MTENHQFFHLFIRNRHTFYSKKKNKLNIVKYDLLFCINARVSIAFSPDLFGMNFQNFLRLVVFTVEK